MDVDGHHSPRRGPGGGPALTPQNLGERSRHSIPFPRQTLKGENWMNRLEKSNSLPVIQHGLSSSKEQAQPHLGVEAVDLPEPALVGTERLPGVHHRLVELPENARLLFLLETPGPAQLIVEGYHRQGFDKGGCTALGGVVDDPLDGAAGAASHRDYQATVSDRDKFVLEGLLGGLSFEDPGELGVEVLPQPRDLGPKPRESGARIVADLPAPIDGPPDPHFQLGHGFEPRQEFAKS